MLFNFKKWLQQAFGSFAQPSRRRGASRPGRGRWSSRRLGLEQLEDRTLPAPLLAITPISWNIIGLDSNNVNVGPNLYLVAARVTNTGDTTATNVRVDYVWDDAIHTSPYINLQDPTKNSQAIAALAPGASTDYYFNVVVTRDPAAYFTARSYHIAASADGVSAVTTPIGRELFVEKILSQNRNSDLVITGPSSVQVGGTYTYHLTSSTAPGGYSQLETFLTFSVSYRIDSVSTTYSQPVGGTSDTIYVDAGGWDNEPSSPDYRTNVGPVNPLFPSGVGGIINTDFTVTILSAGSLNVTGLILDNSGSSFHYDADTGSLFQAINPVDNPPVANNDTASTKEDTAVNINVTANDTDPNNNLAPGTVQVVSGPAHGSTLVNPVTGVVTYTPGANFNGTDTFTYTVKDAGGNTSNPATVTISISPVDDPPVITLPGTQLTPQNIARVFSSGNGNQVSINDVDAGPNPVEVTLSALNGTLTLNGTAGLTFLIGSGTADPTMTFRGTLASINAALNGLSFQPAPDFNGTATLTVTADDLGNTGAGGPLSATNSVNIDVTSVNQPPVNTVPGTQTVLDGQPLVFSPANGNAVSVFDVDAGSNAIITTLSVPNGSLTATAVAGVTITDNGTATVTLTGPQGGINAALNGLTYAPPAGLSGNVTLTVTTDDQGHSGSSGGPQSDTDTVTLRVAPVNATPVNTVPGAQTFDEDTTLVFSGSKKISIADSDAGSASVQVTVSVTTGQLTLSGITGLTFLSGNGTANKSMTFLGSVADINAALDGLSYTPPPNFPLTGLTGSDTLTITTNDLGNLGSGGAKTATSTVALTINAVDDPPVNTVPTGTGYAQFVDFNSTMTFSNANGNPIRVADLDAGTGNLTVTLSFTSGSNHRLSLATTTGLTFTVGDGSNDPTMTFSGTVAAINAALDGLIYNPNNSTPGTYTLTIATSDNGNTGSGGPLTDTDTVAINVQKTVGGGAYNDQAPVNQVPGTQTTTVNTPLTLGSVTGNRVLTSDPDAGTANNFKVTLTATNGTLTLRSLAGLAFTTGDGTADSTMTFTGIIFNINNDLDGLVFTPNAGFSGTAQVTITSDDQGSQGQNGPLSDTDSFNITVSGNAPPANLVPPAQITPEDTSLTFSTGNGNPVSIADPSASGASEKVQLSVAHGTLTLSTTAGLTFNAGSNGSGAMTITGTLTAINNALAGLVYAPAQDYNGPDTLSLTTTNIIDSLSTTNSVPISVTPVDDAPVNNVPGPQSLAANTIRVFSAGTSNPISVSDIDAGTGFVAVKLTVAHGTLSVGGDTSGLGTIVGDGTGTVNLTGTVTALNSALASLTYTPTTDYSGPDTLTVRTDDQGNTGAGGPLVTISTVALTIDPINDAPVNNVPGPQATNEDTAKVFSPGTGNPISVADGDVGSNPVDVTLSVLHGILTLSGTTSLTITAGANGSSSLTVHGPIGAINAALNGLTYGPAPNYSGPDTLTITTNDLQTGLPPGAKSTTSTVALTVYPVNDPPIIAAPGTVQTANEDTPLVFSLGSLNPISVADIDGNGGVEQVTLTAADGTLTLGSTTGLSFITGTGAADSFMIFRGTLTDINAALASLSYTPTTDFNGNTTLTIEANDLGNTGLGKAKTATRTVNLTFNSVDDPPVNHVPGPQATPQNTPLFFNGPNGNPISISDVDAGSSPVQVTLSVTAGTLSLGNTAGLTFSVGNGTPAATMTFTGTVADINAALTTLKYTPALDSQGSAVLTITTDDLGHTGVVLGPTSATNLINLIVTPVNETPTLALPAMQTFAEDTVHVFSIANSNAIQVGDEDAEASEAPVEVTLSAADGTLTLASTDGLTFIRGSGTNDTAVTFRGMVGDINAALDGLSLTPPHDFNGPSYIVVAVNDLGNSGPGGPKIAAGYVLLTITEVNDAPVRTAGSVNDLTVAEDSGTTSLGLNSLAFGPGGGVDENSQTLTYTVTAVPPASLGSIVLADGTTTVTAGSTHTLAELQGMQFQTSPDANGGPATFSFTVTDNGTTDGEADPLSLTESLTIHVTEVNDTPVRTAGSINDLNVTATPTLKSLGFGGLDYGPGGGLDENSQTLTYQVTMVPSAALGTVYLADGTTAVTAGSTYTLAELRGFQFQPVSGADGSDTFTFTVTDDGTTDGVFDPKSLTESLTITVSSSVPIQADGQSLSTNQDTALPITLTATGGNGSSLIYNVTGGPAHGTLTPTGNGTYSYTPDINYHGPDSFTFTASDGSNTSNTATVSIDVLDTSVPNATDQTLSTNQNTALPITLTATDSDGDSLAYTITGGPAHGTLTPTGKGTYSYTPNANYHGPDSFTFTASDGSNTSNTATVSITVLDTSVPTAKSQTLTVNQNTALPMTLTGTDSDGDSLLYTITAKPAHGILTPMGGGTYSYTPNAGYRGPDSFTFTASDGTNTSNTATVSILVKAPSQPAAPPSSRNSGTRSNSPATGQPGQALVVTILLGLSPNGTPGTGPASGGPGGAGSAALGGSVVILGGVFGPLGFTPLNSGGGEDDVGQAGTETAAFWPWLQEFSKTVSQDNGAGPDGRFWPWLQELTPTNGNADAQTDADEEALELSEQGDAMTTAVADWTAAAEMRERFAAARSFEVVPISDEARTRATSGADQLFTAATRMSSTKFADHAETSATTRVLQVAGLSLAFLGRERRTPPAAGRNLFRARSGR